MKILDSSLERVDTEFKLESVLTKLGLFYPLSQCEIIGPKLPKKKKPQRKRSKRIEATEEAFSVDGNKEKGQKRRSNESDDDEDSEYSVDGENVVERDATEQQENEIIKGLVKLLTFESVIIGFVFHLHSMSTP